MTFDIAIFDPAIFDAWLRGSVSVSDAPRGGLSVSDAPRGGVTVAHG